MRIKNLSHGDEDYFDVMDGYVITENLSDELDSATIVIPNTDGIFEPYDLILLELDDSSTHGAMLVANVTKNIISYSPYERYNLTIDLMSMTKWLETVQLPNMAITNIGQNRTIKSYVERVVNRYLIPSLKKSVYDDEAPSKVYVSTYTIPNDVVCPEYTFQSPTLREYLDALFSKLGGIAKLTFSERTDDFDDDYGFYYKYYFSIEVFNLTNIKDPINTTYLTEFTKTQSAEDYVSALSHSIENIIGQDSVVEYQKTKSDDYTITSENACILLNQKVYDIEKLEVSHPSSMSMYVTVTENGSFLVGALAGVAFTNTDEQGITLDCDYNTYGNPEHIYVYMPSSTYWDVTSFLVIPEIYESLETRAAGSYESGDSVAGWNRTICKNNAIVFERGSNKIDGLFKYYSKQKIIGSSSDLTSISSATSISIYNYIQNNSSSFVFTKTNNGRTFTFTITGNPAYEIKYTDSTIYRITYKPYVNARFEIEDGEKNTHHIVMQDNSTNALTDIGLYLAQSVEKNSKLGNPTIIATARVPTHEDIDNGTYYLGQYYQYGADRYVISTIERQMKANETLYKFTLTKNFTNRNLNTIINREKRYFALAKDETVERSEIVYKQYRNINFVSSSTDVQNTLYYGLEGLLDSKFIALSFDTYNENEARITGGIIPLNTIVGGNSIIYSASFMDNVNYKVLPGSVNEDGGYPMQQYKYVDDNGEFAKITSAPVNPSVSDLINQNWVSHTINPSNFLKDQREKVTLNYEFIYKSNDYRIKIGSHFAEALYKKTNVTIKATYYYTDGTSAAGWTYSGFPSNYSIPYNTWYKNNYTAWIQAIILTTQEGDDVMVIYNPPQSAYFNLTHDTETY